MPEPEKKWMIISQPDQPTPSHFWYILGTESAAIAELTSKTQEYGIDLTLWSLHSKSEATVSVAIEQEGD